MSDPAPILDYQSPRPSRLRLPTRTEWTVAGVCLLILGGLGTAWLVRARELANRSTCQANLRGIAQSFCIYADHGMGGADRFPAMPNYNGTSYINNPGMIGQIPMTTDPMVEFNGSFGSSGASPGVASSTPSRILWFLVLRNQVGVKSFLCRSDPFVTGHAQLKDAVGRYYGNFKSTSLSYSIVYPWTSTVPNNDMVPWWTYLMKSDLPMVSDMAPEHGTGRGSQRRNTAALKGAPGSPAIYSSSNHGGEGQNVAFEDAHVEWTTDPYVGQGGDNIWTSGVSNPGVGGTPITRGVAVTPASSKEPYDVYMVPVRNVADGSM